MYFLVLFGMHNLLHLLPLSHLLSSGLMVALKKSTVVPVSCVPGVQISPFLLPNIAAGLAFGTSF